MHLTAKLLMSRGLTRFFLLFSGHIELLGVRRLCTFGSLDSFGHPARFARLGIADGVLL